jgi:hypothetical protein
MLTFPSLAEASEYGQKIKEGVAVAEGLMYIFAALMGLGGILATYILIKNGKGEEAKWVIFGHGSYTGNTF